MSHALATLVLACASSAHALPGPPHDLAAGITCSDCHVPYGGLMGAEVGVASSGATTTLTDIGATWMMDEWVGGVVSFVSGPNDGLFREVTGNGADSLSWSAPLPFPVAPGDDYSLGITTDYDIQTQCKTCHNPMGTAAAMSDVGLHVVGGEVIGCGDCHDPHNLEASSGVGNGLLRAEVRHGSAGAPVVFPSPNPSNDFVAGAAPFDGICETCHTAAAYHRNDASGSHAHEATTACTDCHPHGDGFAATACFGCHNPAPPAGYELAPDMTGLGWDGAYPKGMPGTHTLGSSEDCRACHTLANHQDGAINVALQPDPNGDGRMWSSYLWAPSGALRADWCLECHDDNNGGMSYAPGSALEGWIQNLPARRLTEGPDGTMNKGDFYEGMDIASSEPLPNSIYPTYVHARRGGIGPWGCLECHGGPHDMRWSYVGSRGADACYSCHGGGANANRTDETGATTGGKLDSPYHEYNGGGLFSIASTHDGPLTPGADAMICRQCHDVHRISRQRDAPDGWSLFDPTDVDPAGRSSTPYLGTKTTFCSTCHPTITGTHTGGALCEDCHTWHGSSLPKLLWFDPVAEGVTVAVSPNPATVPDAGSQTFTAVVTNYPAWLPSYAQWSLVPTGGGDPGATLAKDEFPDLALGPPSAVSSDLVVSHLATISGLQFHLDVPHTYRGLLRAEITKDGTTTALLQADSMFDFTADLIFTYDPVSGYLPGSLEYRTSPGPRRPSGDLGVFTGGPVAGTWTLTITDTNPASGATGALDYWELTVNAGTIGTLTPVSDSFDAGFLATYPGTGEVTAGITGGKVSAWPPVQVRVDSAPGTLTVTP